MKYSKSITSIGLLLGMLVGLGPGVASATTLEVGGVPKHEPVEITGSLKSGSSLTLKDTAGSLQNTCTTSHVNASTKSPYTGTSVTGPVSTLSFESCTRSVTVHKPGALEVTWISGTTNGTVYSEEAQVTSGSPIGTLNCTTGATTHIGTLTGAKTGTGTLHINALINCGVIPSTRWEGTYTVTSPTGLGVTEPSALEVGGKPQDDPVEITASLKSGASLILKDTSGFSQNTCSSSHLTASTVSPYTGASITAPIETLSFGSCTRGITVHDPGALEIAWVKASTNGTVYSEEAQITSESPIGKLNCTTGETVKLGTLTGVASGEATMHINALINCGIIPSAKWEGTYSVTSPSGLGLSDGVPTTTVEIGGVRKTEAVEITASLKSGASLILKDTSGFSQNTCSSSHLTASTISPYTGTSVTGPVSTLSFGSCTRGVTVHAPGKLEIFRISGTTNGTVYSEEAQITSESPIGKLNCTTGETVKLGTLTGVASGEATMHINALINCGIIPSAKWEGTYSVTSPSGLGVSG